MIIAFIIFYLVVGITIAVSNRQIEDLTEMPEEERMSDLDFYLWIPILWVIFLVWEVYFQKQDREDDSDNWL